MHPCQAHVRRATSRAPVDAVQQSSLSVSLPVRLPASRPLPSSIAQLFFQQRLVGVSFGRLACVPDAALVVLI
jgi:hypothetical protein